jgi:hypothetical protein
MADKTSRLTTRLDTPQERAAPKRGGGRSRRARDKVAPASCFAPVLSRSVRSPCRPSYITPGAVGIISGEHHTPPRPRSGSKPARDGCAVTRMMGAPSFSPHPAEGCRPSANIVFIASASGSIRCHKDYKTFSLELQKSPIR